MKSSSPPLTANIKAVRGRPVDEEGRAQRRQQIVEAAHACFAAKGFHATSTAEISTEAGISVAGLYQYFPAKNDLIQAMIQHELDRDLAFLQQLEGFDDVFAGLMQLGHFIAGDKTTQTALRLRMEIVAEAARDPQAAELVVMSEKRITVELERLILKGQARGLIDKALAPDNTALVVMAFLDGILSRLAMAYPDQERFVTNAVQLLRRSLAPPLSPK